MDKLHAHYIEVIWFTQSLCLLTWFIVSARRAISMGAYLKENGINGLLQISSDNIVHQELLRLAIGMIMVFASAASLFLAPPPPNYADLPQTVVLLLSWNAVGALMLLQSIVDRAANTRLTKYKRIEVQAVVGIIEPGANAGERAKEVRDIVMEKAVNADIIDEPETVQKANEHE